MTRWCWLVWLVLALAWLSTAAVNDSTNGSTNGSAVDVAGANRRAHRHRKARLIRKYLRGAKKLEGSVRLVEGPDDRQGTVEVFHAGKWGSVCDDEWDQREADVVCRQLGFHSAARATHDAFFGPARRRYWMDNMYCEGRESRLGECRFDGWGTHDCGSSEAAGAVCRRHSGDDDDGSGEDGDSPHEESAAQMDSADPLPALRIQDVLGEVSGPPVGLPLRLRGGRVYDEGRVEVQMPDGSWWLICGDGWSLLEAAVVCRQLGYGYANDAAQTDFFGGNASHVRLGGVRCHGNEDALAQCTVQHLGLSAPGNCPGRGQSVAGVVCTKTIADLVPDPNELYRTVHLEDRQLFYLQCALEENCLASPANRLQQENSYNWHLESRRLLRFTARIANIGTADFRPSIPKHMWQWHACHMHYHSMEVFAQFDVLDGRGRKVAEGHKASFCLEDNECIPGVSTGPRYACANYGDQGISPGCSDIYRHNIDCQWVDVTELKPGVYVFRMSINPELKVAEASFDNNALSCTLFYSESYAHITNCTYHRPS